MTPLLSLYLIDFHIVMLVGLDVGLYATHFDWLIDWLIEKLIHERTTYEVTSERRV